MSLPDDAVREMEVLEQIERDPDISQASLATRLGVAVGTVNLLIKRMVSKGYVKVKRAQRRKLRYIITPEGIAFRARLTVDYIEQSLLLFRRTRQRARDLLGEARQRGYEAVRIDGEGDLADICRLTCMEEGVRISAEPGLPVLQVRGLKVVLALDGPGTNVTSPLIKKLEDRPYAG